MEFTQCVEILNARQQCGHVDCVRCPVAPIPRSGMSISEGPAPSVAATSDELLSSMNSLELVNLFTSLQCERVQVSCNTSSHRLNWKFIMYWFGVTFQVYLGYNNALQQLVDNDLVDEYPSLCAEITSIFSVLSKQVVSIKVQPAKHKPINWIKQPSSRILRNN